MLAPEPPEPAATRRWRFAEALLDERNLELSVGGQPVDLERKPLDVLLHLLRHAGEVVTKEELAEACWPGRILSDTVLTTCMSKLRQGLADEAQKIVKTVHGYGYRLVASVTVDVPAGTPPPPVLNFKPGDSPSQRSSWKLVERLGSGGHGEVWLARHEKTQEPRVYKFAVDGAVLTSLKREITLYRVLHDSLGERPDFVRLFDWNLHEQPYYLESEYVAGGSLEAWLQAQGGFEHVPLSQRLELIAQIAETVAAAHSVGVLHKDLKPANVLIVPHPDGPRTKLCDFGSGGVIHAGKLEQLGITRMGFTRTLALGELTSGTPIYIAPEVLAGQPLTVQADIYSLGVMLYQMVIGDLRLPLASGWEHNVTDELLREDIAAAADGNPQRRLADAVALAQRLRTLEQRRAHRAAERAAQAKIEAALRTAERLRSRRRWLLAVMGLLVAGLAAITVLYVDARRARIKAERAEATTAAVSQFLNQDLFKGISTEATGTQDLTVKTLLDRAAKEVDTRFVDQLDVAARIHLAVADGYGSLGFFLLAQPQLERALALSEQRYGRHARETLDVLESLAANTDMLDRHAESSALYAELERALVEREGPQSTRVLALRPAIAWANFNAGNFQQAAGELQTLLKDANTSGAFNADQLADVRSRLSSFLFWLGEYHESEQMARTAIAHQSTFTGTELMNAAVSRMILSGSLVELGRLDEADAELSAAMDIVNKQVNPDDPFMGTAFTYLGRLRLAQGRTAEGTALLERALAIRQKLFGADGSSLVSWTRHLVGEAYAQAGKLPEAAQALREALAVNEKTDGPAHPFSIKIRVTYADVLRETGDTAKAAATLATIEPKALATLPPAHPFRTEYLRVQGLLWLKQGQSEKARAALSQVLQTYEECLGPQHWRTQRARKERSLAT